MRIKYVFVVFFVGGGHTGACLGLMSYEGLFKIIIMINGR